MVRAGREAAELLAQQARQHGNDGVHQVDAGAALQGLSVERTPGPAATALKFRRQVVSE